MRCSTQRSSGPRQRHGNGTANHRRDTTDTWSLEAEASSNSGHHEETSRNTRRNNATTRIYLRTSHVPVTESLHAQAGLGHNPSIQRQQAEERRRVLSDENLYPQEYSATSAGPYPVLAGSLPSSGQYAASSPSQHTASYSGQYGEQNSDQYPEDYSTSNNGPYPTELLELDERYGSQTPSGGVAHGGYPFQPVYTTSYEPVNNTITYGSLRGAQASPAYVCPSSSNSQPRYPYYNSYPTEDGSQHQN